MAYCRALSKNFLRNTEEDHETSVRIVVLRTKIEHENCRIRMLSIWLRRFITCEFGLPTFCLIELLLLVVFSLLILILFSLFETF